LKNQIPAGLNFSLSGIPYWNTDTGGFFNNRSTGNGDPNDPNFQEFFVRWFQFSSFCPMFRVHSSSGLNPGREFYRFDEKTQRILRSYLDLRYRLLPYLYSVAWQVTSAGGAFMRPLVMDFPMDPQVLGIGDQYLFGPAIMVALRGSTFGTGRLPPPAKASTLRPGWIPCRCSSGRARLFPWGHSSSIPARNRPIPWNCASTAARMGS
jgi:hypothetical protein